MATNDCHYLNREDAEAHEVLLCIQTGKTMEDQDRMRFGSDHFYLKTPDEMKESFATVRKPSRTRSKLRRAAILPWISTRSFCRISRLTRKDRWRSTFRRWLWQGWRGFSKTVPYQAQNGRREKYEKRLQMELDIINKMGFAGYFLIVSDFVNYAKRSGIPVGPGQGSGAGSLVAYRHRDNHIDPIRYKLVLRAFP